MPHHMLCTLLICVCVCVCALEKGRDRCPKERSCGPNRHPSHVSYLTLSLSLIAMQLCRLPPSSILHAPAPSHGINNACRVVSACPDLQPACAQQGLRKEACRHVMPHYKGIVHGRSVRKQSLSWTMASSFLLARSDLIIQLSLVNLVVLFSLRLLEISAMLLLKVLTQRFRSVWFVAPSDWIKVTFIVLILATTVPNAVAMTALSCRSFCGPALIKENVYLPPLRCFSFFFSF